MFYLIQPSNNRIVIRSSYFSSKDDNRYVGLVLSVFMMNQASQLNPILKYDPQFDFPYSNKIKQYGRKNAQKTQKINLRPSLNAEIRHLKPYTLNLIPLNYRYPASGFRNPDQVFSIQYPVSSII
jgi:hypothetical protein